MAKISIGIEPFFALGFVNPPRLRIDADWGAVRGKKAMVHILRLLAECRRGATAVEYGLILAVVVLTMFGALQLTAGATTDLWNNVSNKVQAAH